MSTIPSVSSLNLGFGNDDDSDTLSLHTDSEDVSDVISVVDSDSFSDEDDDDDEDDFADDLAGLSVNPPAPITNIIVGAPTPTQAGFVLEILPQPATPQIQLPQPVTPQIQLPQPATPQVQLPQPATPQIQLPQGMSPQVQGMTPQVQLPQPVTPQVQLPQPVQTQGMGPQVQLPQGMSPQVQLPQGMSPQVQLPQGMNPQVQLPQPVQTQGMTPQAQQVPIGFQIQGRQLIMQTPVGLLDAYADYFKVLKGTYEQGPQVAQWTFPMFYEKDVKDVVTRIITGVLPPPSQLAVPQSRQVDLSAPPPLPSQTDRFETQTSVIQPGLYELPQPAPARTKGSRRTTTAKPAEQQTVAPSQAIVTTIPSGMVLPTEVPTANLPPYNPTDKEPGESQAAYERRKTIYEALINYVLPNGQRIPPESADILSRMRNNVDIEGVTYNEIAMRVLNTYLPVQGK